MRARAAMPGEVGGKTVIGRETDWPDDGMAGSAVLRKVARRLIPFLFLLYLANILDRTNVGFARLRMLADLHLGEEVYGWGATFCFYLGYLLFEVPSNLILHRVGARRWISRIMITWGIVSACTMFVRDAKSFYLVRILLGIAEAGFFPGIVLYLSYWFPARERARAVALFMMASPLSGVVGGPLSGNLLEYTDGAWGLAGWQWLFLIEGIPSVALGIVTWWYLTDRPEKAGWLTPDERSELSARMAREEKSREERHGLHRLQALADPRVGLFILLYFTIALGSNAFGFYAPEILKRHFSGWRDDAIGYLYLVPNLTTAAAMFLIGLHSDRTGERRWHLAWCALFAAAGWGLSATVHSPWLVLMALTAAQAGMISMIGPFWSLSTSFMSGIGAVGGIALINTIANTGGAFSSPLMSWLGKTTGSFAAGQVVMAATMALGAGIALAIRHDPAADRAF
jgi:ACS family tartrate transporter-like MFS transporter